MLVSSLEEMDAENTEMPKRPLSLECKNPRLKTSTTEPTRKRKCCHLPYEMQQWMLTSVLMLNWWGNQYSWICSWIKM